MLTASMLVKAMEGVLFDSRGMLNQFFTNLLQDLIDSRIENCRETLVAIAHGVYKQKDLSRWTGYKNKEISKHLKILIEKSLIYPSGGVYRFYDKVLRFWLKNVYHKRRRTLVDNISDKTKIFQDEMEELIKQFAIEERLDIAVRLKQLFDSFNNETVSINSKTRRLKRFEKTEIIEEEGKRYIVGHIKDKVSLACLSKEKLDENDILEFIKYGMKYKPNLQRRIIIPLNDMEINARLMAKEIKMWIWELDEINELLDIFGKHKIVRV